MGGSLMMSTVSLAAAAVSSRRGSCGIALSREALEAAALAGRSTSLPATCERGSTTRMRVPRRVRTSVAVSSASTRGLDVVVAAECAKEEFGAIVAVCVVAAEVGAVAP